MAFILLLLNRLLGTDEKYNPPIEGDIIVNGKKAAPYSLMFAFGLLLFAACAAVIAAMWPYIYADTHPLSWYWSLFLLPVALIAALLTARGQARANRFFPYWLSAPIVWVAMIASFITYTVLIFGAVFGFAALLIKIGILK